MYSWIDKMLVLVAVLASVGYAAYSLGPKTLRNRYSRFATKYFGLRAARWFAGSAMKGSHDCHDCSARATHMHIKSDDSQKPIARE